MPRPATGSLKFSSGRWYGKFSRSDGTRTEWIALDPKLGPDDEPKARALAASMAAKIKARTAPTDGAETVATYAERWLDDREGRVNSIRDDRSRIRDHVLPVLGSLDVRTFTRDDVYCLCEPRYRRDAMDGADCGA